MMALIDISRTIGPKTTVYPGDSQVEFDVIASMSGNDPCNITEIKNFTTHLLTHVDAPRHFIADGETLDDLSLSRFSGPALVIEVKTVHVTEQDVPEALSEGTSVLFKTSNSTRQDDSPFDEAHVYLTAEAARALVNAGVNVVGIDGLSVDRFGDEEYTCHKTLLGNGVLILEGLRLGHVEPGSYVLRAYPLRVAQGDGSPVRAVLES
jgi:arylformamidase